MKFQATDCTALAVDIDIETDNKMINEHIFAYGDQNANEDLLNFWKRQPNNVSFLSILLRITCMCWHQVK